MKDYSALIDASMMLGVFFFVSVTYAILTINRATRRLQEVFRHGKK